MVDPNAKYFLGFADYIAKTIQRRDISWVGGAKRQKEREREELKRELLQGSEKDSL